MRSTTTPQSSRLALSCTSTSPRRTAPAAMPRRSSVRTPVVSIKLAYSAGLRAWSSGLANRVRMYLILMSKTDDNQIQPRTKGERAAYAQGYAQAIITIDKEGMAAAVDWLREMVELDRLMEQLDGEK